MRVVGPAEWAFTPATASSCGDFAFAGIKLRGHIEVKQCVSGPAGVAIGLSNGDSTVTDAAGAFVFGPLIPGAYCANSVTASTWTLKDYQKNVRKNKFYVFRVS